jgi:hypothetical protein
LGAQQPGPLPARASATPVPAQHVLAVARMTGASLLTTKASHEDSLRAMWGFKSFIFDLPSIIVEVTAQKNQQQPLLI